MVGSVNQPTGEFGERICRNFALGGNPIDSGVSAEPSLLAPGESTGTCHRRFERVTEWCSVLDVVKQFGIAKCLTSSTTKT
jgi:copper homeostasis protein CutC